MSSHNVAGDQPASRLSFVAGIGELDSVKRNKALLVGSAVFISIRDLKAENYTKVLPRATSAWRKAWAKKDQQKLYVSVRTDILVNSPKTMRFAFAVDAYLKWGFKQRGGTVLLSGYEDGSQTSVEVFIFKDGVLTSFEDKRLPSQRAPHFQDGFSTLIETLKENFPDHRMVVAAPLQKPAARYSNITYVDEKVFAALSFRPLEVFTERRLSEFRWPAAIVGAAVLFYAGAMSLGWMEREAAKSAFIEAQSDPVVKGRGGMDSGLIDTIQQRRFFLDQARHQEVLAEKAKQLMAGIAQVNGVKIIQVKLPAPSLAGGPAPVGVPAPQADVQAGTKPDVWIKVSVPAMQIGTWEQSGLLMRELSKNTGMDLRLERNGWSEDAATGRRTYSMEGTIHG